MEVALAGLVGILFSISIYLLISTYIIRMLLGVVLLGTSVNLSVFVAGRIGPIAPPLIPNHLEVPPQAIASPLPQALILTAIVIGLALTVVLATVVLRGWRATGSLDARDLDLVEPRPTTEAVEPV